MEQFSLEKYLQDPTRKVITRQGYPARIICTDREGVHDPLIALVKRGGGEDLLTYSKDGKYSHHRVDNDLDLFFAPRKQSRWIFLRKCEYIDKIERSNLYGSKEVAEEVMKKHKGFALTEITWEE